jgi:general secretion pathway protein J
MKNKQGFTLLEILIAVLILSIISIIMIRGLQIMMTTKSTIERNAQQLQSLSLAMTFLQQDLTNAQNRPVLLVNGTIDPAMFLASDAFQTLTFTRGSVSNPLGENRSTLLRVAYQLNNGNLIRETWSSLDQNSKKPDTRILLTQLTQLQWKFWGSDHRWYLGWPGTSSYPLPQAVQITLQFSNGKILQRIFIVTSASIATTGNSSSGRDSNGAQN